MKSWIIMPLLNLVWVPGRGQPMPHKGKNAPLPPRRAPSARTAGAARSVPLLLGCRTGKQSLVCHASHSLLSRLQPLAYPHQVKESHYYRADLVRTYTTKGVPSVPFSPEISAKSRKAGERKGISSPPSRPLGPPVAGWIVSTRPGPGPCARRRGQSSLGGWVQNGAGRVRIGSCAGGGAFVSRSCSQYTLRTFGVNHGGI